LSFESKDIISNHVKVTSEAKSIHDEQRVNAGGVANGG
jgi:hypothetical protein